MLKKIMAPCTIPRFLVLVYLEWWRSGWGLLSKGVSTETNFWKIFRFSDFWKIFRFLGKFWKLFRFLETFQIFRKFSSGKFLSFLPLTLTDRKGVSYFVSFFSSFVHVWLQCFCSVWKYFNHRQMQIYGEKPVSL